MSWTDYRQLAVIAVVWLTASAVDAADHEVRPTPLPARVVTAGAVVRSGPAESYYPTDSLPEDAIVGVYRREPDGWCAIRPPAESYSWVYAKHVRLVDERLGKIDKDEVPARVGSRLSSRRTAIQVRMHEGETVQLIDQDDRDGKTWYKIAPPAGEFRWVHANDLDFGDSDGDLKKWDRSVTTTSHEEQAQAGTAASDLAPAVEVEAPPLASTGEVSASVASGSKPSSTASATTEATSTSTIPPSSAELSQRLDELELRLSRVVAEPAATWNVHSLMQSAEQLLTAADTVADREAVKRTLAKIDQFAAIQRRYTGVSQATAGRSLMPPPASRVAQSPLPVSRPNYNLANGQYDAVGVLRPVVSQRPGAPQFALVNEQGEVATFVTAPPDVNLQPYLGRRIGVAGNRGYIPEFHRAHVTAGRVTPLNDRLLR